MDSKLKYFWLSLLLFLLCPISKGQVNNNGPQIVQAHVSGIQSACGGGFLDFKVFFCDNVTANNVSVVCTSVIGDPATPVSYAVSDTRGTTYSCRPPEGITSITTPSTSGAWINTQMCYGTIPSSGLNTVTVGIGPGLSYGIVAAEVSGITSTLDTSATKKLGSSPANITHSLTTTNNSSAIFSCGGVNSGYSIARGQQQTLGNDSDATFSFLDTSINGSYTVGNTATGTGGGYPSAMTLQSIALQSNSITVDTTEMAKADTVHAYKQTLKASGGIGAYTWSNPGGGLGTIGLSLNTSTGAITGTTSASPGIYNFNAQVTDGTNTSSPVTLSITVVGNFDLPSLVQTANISSPGSSLNKVVFQNPVVNGNISLIFFNGFDTHGGIGWYQKLDGANNFISDTFGDTYKRVCKIGGTWNTSTTVYAAKINGCGSNSVTITKTVDGSSLNWFATEWKGAQTVLDCGDLSYFFPAGTSPNSFTASLSTIFPNESIIDFATSSKISFDTTVLGFNSPFTLISTGGAAFDQDSIGIDNNVAVGSYTGTATLTSTLPNESAFFSELLGVLPDQAVSQSCGPVKHKVDIY